MHCNWSKTLISHCSSCPERSYFFAHFCHSHHHHHHHAVHLQKGDIFFVHNDLGDGWLWVTAHRTGEQGLVFKVICSLKNIVCKNLLCPIGSTVRSWGVYWPERCIPLVPPKSEQERGSGLVGEGGTRKLPGQTKWQQSGRLQPLLPHQQPDPAVSHRKEGGQVQKLKKSDQEIITYKPGMWWAAEHLNAWMQSSWDTKPSR